MTDLTPPSVGLPPSPGSNEAAADWKRLEPDGEGAVAPRVTLMVLLGLYSIREATFLFRGPNRLTP